jgi:hypothetical protein
MLLDLLVSEGIELQGDMKFKNCAGVGVLDQLWFGLFGNLLEQLFVRNVKVNVLLLQLFYVLLYKVGSNGIVLQ